MLKIQRNLKTLQNVILNQIYDISTCMKKSIFEDLEHKTIFFKIVRKLSENNFTLKELWGFLKVKINTLYFFKTSQC